MFSSLDADDDCDIGADVTLADVAASSRRLRSRGGSGGSDSVPGFSFIEQADFRDFISVPTIIDERSEFGFSMSTGKGKTKAPVSTVTSTKLSDEELDDLLDCVEPVYLRDSTTLRLYADKMKDLEIDSMIKGSRHQEEKKPVSKPKWKVQEVDLNAWRQNRIDHRTIYNMPEVPVPRSPTLRPMLHPPLTPPHDSLVRENTSEMEREKTYIMKVRQTTRSPSAIASRRFMRQTMTKFNRPRSPDGPALYRDASNSEILRKQSPRTETVKRLPSSVQRWTRSVFRGSLCDHTDIMQKQHCDVLGPAVCRNCIEYANKKIASEVQRTAFGSMDFSVTTVVAPKLARLLVKQTKNDKSKVRLHNNPSANRRTSNGGGALKLPAIGGIGAGQEFGRPGVEQYWMERSRTMLTSGHGASSSRVGRAPNNTPHSQFVRSRSNTRPSIVIQGAPPVTIKE